MSMSPKSSLQLYRDCLRLIRHVAGKSPKAVHLQQIVSSQFRKNKFLTNDLEIHEAKQAAERVLSNYFLFEHVQKDPKLQEMQAKSWAQAEEADNEYQAAVETVAQEEEPALVDDGEDESLYPTEEK